MKSFPLWPWILAGALSLGAAAAALQLVDALQRGREAEALSTLRAIASAQDAFRERDADRDGTLDYAGELQPLIDAQLLAAPISLPGPYRYRIATGRSPEFLWMAVAVPERPGDRCFAVNQTGVIWVGAAPAPLNPECALPSPECDTCGSRELCEHLGIGR